MTDPAVIREFLTAAPELADFRPALTLKQARAYIDELLELAEKVKEWRRADIADDSGRFVDAEYQLILAADEMFELGEMPS